MPRTAGAAALHTALLAVSVAAAAGTADYTVGMVRTVAGSSLQNSYVDGVGTSARFDGIKSIALTPDKRTAVVVDRGNSIRRVDMLTREVSTLAGSLNDACAVADGVGTAAQFCRPRSVEISPDDPTTAWIYSESGSLRNASLDGTVPAPPKALAFCESLTLQECRAYGSEHLPWLPVEEIESCGSSVPTGCSIYRTVASPVRTLQQYSIRSPAAACEGWCDRDEHCQPGLRCIRVGKGRAVPGCTGTAPREWGYCFDPSQIVAFNKCVRRTDDNPDSGAIGAWEARVCRSGGVSPWQKRIPDAISLDVRTSAGFSGSETWVTWRRGAQYSSASEGVGVGVVGNRIFKFDLSRPESTVSMLAGFWGGSEDNYGFADGFGSFARFNRPSDLVVTADGRAIVVDYGNHCLRRVNISTGETSTFVGRCASGGVQDGIGTSARMRDPQLLLAVGNDSVLVLPETYSWSAVQTIRLVHIPSRRITSLPTVTGLTSMFTPISDNELLVVEFNSIKSFIVRDHCRAHAGLVGNVCKCDPGFITSVKVFDTSPWNSLRVPKLPACVPCQAGTASEALACHLPVRL